MVEVVEVFGCKMSAGSEEEVLLLKEILFFGTAVCVLLSPQRGQNRCSSWFVWRFMQVHMFYFSVVQT